MTTADYLLSLAPAWVWWTGYGVGCALTIVGFGAASRDSFSSGSDDFGLFSFLLTVLGWPMIVLVLTPLLAIGGLYHIGHWLAGKPWKRQRRPTNPRVRTRGWQALLRGASPIPPQGQDQ